MQYTIELPENKKFFTVKTFVPVTRELARQWRAELNEKSRALNIRKFLVDVRCSKNVSSVIENYLYAYEDIKKLNVPQNIRLAILVSEDDHSHDFVETTLINAGYYVRIFTDEISAIKWLEGC